MLLRGDYSNKGKCKYDNVDGINRSHNSSGRIEKYMGVLVEMWRKEYTTVRPHSSLGYKPPAPKAILPSELRVAV